VIPASASGPCLGHFDVSSIFLCPEPFQIIGQRNTDRNTFPLLSLLRSHTPCDRRFMRHRRIPELSYPHRVRRSHRQGQCATYLSNFVDPLAQLWDLASKTLLTTFQFPQTITRLAWDVSERLFFASSNTGSIYEMNMFQERATRLGMEAIGGAGLTDIIRVGDDENTTIKNKKLISVGSVLSCTVRIHTNCAIANRSPRCASR